MSEIRSQISWGLLAALVAACGGGHGESGPGAGMGAPEGPGQPDAGSPDTEAPDAGALPPIDPDELREDRSVYDQDDLEVRAIHLTVTDEDGLDDVHDDEPGARVDVLFQQGDFGHGQTEPNAWMRLRGASTRSASQKSYRIELFDQVEPWRGFQVINLNKHPYDLSRVRQKLSFDYFQEIRHFAGLRTGFVRLYINGEDMGFYTQVERPGERSLAAHGLDPLGQLYKAEYFRFQHISDDTWADDESLEDYLDAKANPDHAKLREMLAAVRDEDRDIDEVIDIYFHRDNFLTWWAINILMGNFDTTDQNFFLYSPSDSKRWYFLPWDYDDSWGTDESPQSSRPRGRYETGVATWWRSVLQQRFVREPGNVDDLVRMVDHLAGEVITPARTAEMLARYGDILFANVGVLPDVERLPAGDVDEDDHDAVMDVFAEELARLPAISASLRQELHTSLDWPLPVRIEDEVARADGTARFTWTESFDLQGDGITYDIHVATRPTMEPGTIVAERTGLTQPWADIDISSGNHFVRVIARDDADPERHWQTAINSYKDEDEDIRYKGIARVEVD